MTTRDGTMNYEDFEWQLLRLVYEEGLDRLEPSYLAYALGMTHERVTAFLERATTAGLVDMDVGDQGRLTYRIPGLDQFRELPEPIWKDIEEQFDVAPPADASGPEAKRIGTDGPARPPQTTGAAPPKGAMEPPPGLDPAPATDGRPGDEPPAPARAHEHHRPQQAPPANARRRLAVAQHPQLPSALRRHIEAHYGGNDQPMMRLDNRSPVVGTEASVNDPTSTAMVALGNDEKFPFRVEACDDTYCDPTQTVFMRQIKVHGAESEQEVRHHVQRLFESFGYRVVQAEDQRLRFERGSVTFILALVPLFVLVLPLFVYLFLYCMGRSTIHQEPVELDVQFRRQIEDGEPVFEIDLTFIGLHGVVLGAADQRVLNQEIDTLRDELRWSLSPG